MENPHFPLIFHWFSMIFHDFPLIFHDFPWWNVSFPMDFPYNWLQGDIPVKNCRLFQVRHRLGRVRIGPVDQKKGDHMCVYIYINIIYYNILHLYNIYILYICIFNIYILLLSFIGLVDVWANINYLFLGGTERVEFWWNKRRKITQSM